MKSIQKKVVKVESDIDLQGKTNVCLMEEYKERKIKEIVMYQRSKVLDKKNVQKTIIEEKYRDDSIKMMLLKINRKMGKKTDKFVEKKLKV